MNETLEMAAKAAGLQDLDLLKLAPTDTTPDKAVADLKGRYPGAFANAGKHARDMSPEEFSAAKAKMKADELVRSNEVLNDSFYRQQAEKWAGKNRK